MNEGVKLLVIGLFLGILLTLSVAMVHNALENDKREAQAIDECIFVVSTTGNKSLDYSRAFCESTMIGDNIIGGKT